MSWPRTVLGGSPEEETSTCLLPEELAQNRLQVKRAAACPSSAGTLMPGLATTCAPLCLAVAYAQVKVPALRSIDQTVCLGQPCCIPDAGFAEIAGIACRPQTTQTSCSMHLPQLQPDKVCLLLACMHIQEKREDTSPRRLLGLR